MRTVAVALAAGLTLLAIAIGLTLLRSPTVAARRNGNPGRENRIASVRRPATYCQRDELLPRGSTAIRLALGATTGPLVKVTVGTGGKNITGGTRAAGWTGRVVTVPLKPLPQNVPGTTVCVSFYPHYEGIIVFGGQASPLIASYEGTHVLPGRIWIEFLRPGSRSWASLIPSTVSHFALGRAATGTWNALLAVALLAAVTIVTSVLLMRELP